MKGKTMFLNSIFSVAVASVGLFADEPKQSAPVKPIEVVELQRKDPVSYDKDVEPIFVKKCNFCHSGNIKEGKLDMSTFEALMKGGKKGASIVPGKSKESLLYQLAGKTQRPSMPPKSEEPLTPQELAIVKLWIDQGAKAPSAARVKPKIIVSLPPAVLHPIRGLAFNKDKTALFAAVGNTILQLDASTGETKKKFVGKNITTKDGKKHEVSHVSLVESLAISPDGKNLASGSFQELRIWNTDTGEEVRKIEGFSDRIVALAFSPDGKLLATAGGPPTEEGEVKLIEVASGKVVQDLKGAHSDTAFGVSFSADGKMLATCGADKFVKIFNVADGKFIKSFEGHTHHVLDVGWKSDGKFLASAGADNAIKVWDFEKGEQARTVNGHSKQVTKISFTSTNPQFATTSGDKTLRLWNADNGSAVKTFPAAEEFLYALAVSQDSKLFAAGGDAGNIYLFDDQGKLLKKLDPLSVPKEAPKAPDKK